jgi:hypothetical protein
MWSLMEDEVYMCDMLLILNKYKDQVWKAVTNIEQSLLHEVTIILKCVEHKVEHV